MLRSVGIGPFSDVPRDHFLSSAEFLCRYDNLDELISSLVSVMCSVAHNENFILTGLAAYRLRILQDSTPRDRAATPLLKDKNVRLESA